MTIDNAQHSRAVLSMSGNLMTSTQGQLRTGQARVERSTTPSVPYESLTSPLRVRYESLTFFSGQAGPFTVFRLKDAEG